MSVQLKAAGLPNVLVHDLRHTAWGQNPKIVQEMLGHSNISVTMDIYSHVTPTPQTAAAAKMQILFAKA